MSHKQNLAINEEELDLFIKEQLELLGDNLDVNTLMTNIHAEASNNDTQVSKRDGRPGWIHFS